MRTYSEKVILVKDRTYCNCCGRELINEDFVEVSKSWGYFSSKDGEQHEFELCEGCYDKIISDFMISPKVNDITEI